MRRYEIKSLPTGVYRLQDNGTRCIKAPCPNINVTPVGPGDEGASVSDIEYPSTLPQEERKAIMDRLFEPGGVTARGFVRGEVEGGLFVLEEVVDP